MIARLNPETTGHDRTTQGGPQRGASPRLLPEQYDALLEAFGSGARGYVGLPFRVLRDPELRKQLEQLLIQEGLDPTNLESALRQYQERQGLDSSHGLDLMTLVELALSAGRRKEQAARAEAARPAPAAGGRASAPMVGSPPAAGSVPVGQLPGAQAANMRPPGGAATPGSAPTAGRTTEGKGKSTAELGIANKPGSVANNLRMVDQFDDSPSRGPTGCGRASATMVANAWREKVGLPPVSQTQMRQPANLLADLRDHLPPGVGFRDSNFDHRQWPAALDQAAAEGKPSIIGVGPPFSPGYGHIMVIAKIEGDKVTLMDPNGGRVRETTKQALLNARPHSEGSFFITVG